MIKKFKEFLNENAEDDDYVKVVKALTAKNIPCKVSLIDDEICIECGFDYPDELFDKIMDITEPMGINVDVMADMSGGNRLRSTRIAGGPKRY